MATQILTARDELLIAVEGGYVTREDAAADLHLYDQLLGAM